MKKFTFMLIAAFVAVASFAVAPSAKTVLQKRMSLSEVKTATKQQVVPSKEAKQIVASPKAPSRLKARKAPRKISGTADLEGTFIAVNAIYDYDSEEGGLVEAIIPESGDITTITKIDDTTIGITGLIGGDQQIIATVDVETSTLTIATGQTLMETDYGPIIMENVSDEGDITGTIYDGGIVLNQIWTDVIGGDGDYAGYMWSGYYYYTMLLPPNGTMSWSNAGKFGDGTADVLIWQDEESHSTTVYNFVGMGVVLSIDMKEDNVFSISSQLAFEGSSTTGNYSFCGLTDDLEYFQSTVTGTGTENKLTLDGYWTFISENNYWYNLFSATTITLTDGSEFVYPVIEDVAATPANPEIVGVGNYDASKEYGYIAFTVPTKDVDGNDIKESELYYTLYSDINGEISPITFSPDLYVKLEEDLTEIPYTFTDSYDFADYGTYKVVYLNYNFNTMYDRIGVKSIYKGGGEVNESETVWADVEKDEPDEPVVTPSVEWIAAEQGYENAEDVTEIQISSTITGTLDKADGTSSPKYYTSGEALRMYANNTLTITSEEPMLKIVFTMTGSAKQMSLEADRGEYEFADTVGTWTGNETEVVFTVPSASGSQARIKKIVVYLVGGESPDVLVTLPEGVEAEEFTLTLDNNYGVTETTKLVAFDGNDVYVQGLAYYFPESFVKGTLNEDGQYVFKSGQFVGEDEYGAEYLIGLSVDEEDYFQYEPEFVFDFDAESRKLSLVEGTYFGESSEKNKVSLWTYTYSAVYTEGALVLPDPVEAPNVEAETWYLVANGYSGKVKGEEIGVAVDGSDIYLQGLCSYLPEAWVKGTIEDGKATFPGGQFYGAYVQEYDGEEYSYNLFFGGYGYDEDTDETYLSDVVFDYDAEAGTLTTQDYILLNSSANFVSFYDYYNEVSITRDKPEFAQPVEAPEDLVTEPYMFTAFNTYFEEDMTPYEVQVGFYGTDEVYIQGLSTYVEEAWVKGTLENGVLTIPETYLGEYEGWGTSDLYFPETEFIYDAEAGKFTCEDGFTTYDDDGYAYDEVSNVVLKKIVETAATPADPSVKNFVLIGVDDEGNTTDADDNPIFVTYPRVEFDIPVVDVNGDPMLQDKLSYVIYVVDKDGVLKELTLTTDLYEKLEEDMTEIPYLFDDDLDIYTGGKTVYLNQDPKEIITWKKIGVQSIYCGLGEEHRSNIGWFDITGYLNKNIFTTGIRNIAADNQETDYFDLQGRMVTAIQKGMLIKQTRNANGTVKTVKVVRK